MTTPKVTTLLLALCFGAITGGCDRTGTDPAPPPAAPPAAAVSEGTAIADGTAEFAGSESCRDCHERFYELWSTSHHGTAMQPFTAELAQMAFSFPSTDIRIGEHSYRAELSEGGGLVRETSADGEQAYPIEHVMGGKNVFFLLTPMDRGRLQVLPLAFDVNSREWYDTTASMVRHFADLEEEAVHWTDWRLTFNTSCYSCHVSQLETNFDAESDTYNTAWAEPGINCETCHGPASAHNRAFREAGEDEMPEDPQIISTSAFTIDQNNHTCAPCHAKMTPLTSTFTPGDRFFDHFDIQAFENADFYPDGRDLGENFTYTLWLMSPCVQSGQLSCLHCHTSSGRYRFADENPNGACLPCHAERVSNAEAHTHHPPDSEAGRCISCHMPMTAFARMRRSDHSMLPPTPAATLAFGSPNACNICHTDQDAVWADEHVRAWRERDFQAAVLHRAGLIDAARRDDFDRLPEMLAFVTDESSDPVFVASLIRLLRASDDARKWPALIESLDHSHPLVRSAAAAGLEGYFTRESVSGLLGVLEDDMRVVRSQAALALAALPREMLGEDDQLRLERASQEYEQTQQARPDIWSTHYNLGNYWMNRGELERSVQAFETALGFDPDNALPWNNLSVVFARQGDNARAEDALRRSLAIEPDSAATNFNFALLMAEHGAASTAEQHLLRALEIDPDFARAAFNLCALLGEERPDEAMTWCRRAAEIRPNDPQYSYALAYYLRRNGDITEALDILHATTAQGPTHLGSVMLLGEILQERGQVDEAITAYRQALERADLHPADVAQLHLRIQALTSE